MEGIVPWLMADGIGLMAAEQSFFQPLALSP
jgi:hypothetical protein